MIGAGKVGRLVSSAAQRVRHAFGARARAGASRIRINLVSTSQDSVLHEVRNTIDDWAPGDRQAVEQTTRATSPLPGVRTMDLIAHSTGEHSLLDLGGWVVDASAAQVFGSLRQEMRILGISSIRLLGCGTATTTHAWDVMQRIYGALNPDGAEPRIDVVGTTDVVIARYFNRIGYNEEFGKILRSATAPGPASLPETLSFDGIGEPAPAGAFAAQPLFDVHPAGVVDPVLRILRHVDLTVGREVGGLLCAPCQELLFNPSAGGPMKIHRVQILYQWRLVRVFSSHRPGGVVYPVRSRQDSEALRSMLGG